MGGRGTSSGFPTHGPTGVNSETFFADTMSSQVKQFQAVLNNPKLDAAFREYVSGMVGGASKAGWDDSNGVSRFIDSAAANPLKVTNNPVLYRGGTLTDAEFHALKVGSTFDAMDSKNQLTSWSDREIVAHMYAEDSSGVWGQGGSNPHNVVVVDTSNTTDGVVVPYTYPQNEVLRSKSVSYKITRIVDASQYKAPIGREKEAANDTYKSPVTYIYVKSVRAKT